MTDQTGYSYQDRSTLNGDELLGSFRDRNLRFGLAPTTLFRNKRGRSHPKTEPFLHTPDILGQSRCHRRSTFSFGKQALMRCAEVVETTDQVHPGFNRLRQTG